MIGRRATRPEAPVIRIKPDHGVFVSKAGFGQTARQFAQQLAARNLKTIRQMTREHRDGTVLCEQSLDDASPEKTRAAGDKNRAHERSNAFAVAAHWASVRR